MKSLTEKQIKTLMHSYTAKGGSQHRKKRYQGLLNMINEIFNEEKISDLDKIGKNQIIGYWRRHRAESEKTLNEKWSVLNVLFAKLNKPEPPRPNYRMTKYLVRKEKKRVAQQLK